MPEILEKITHGKGEPTDIDMLRESTRGVRYKEENGDFGRSRE